MYGFEYLDSTGRGVSVIFNNEKFLADKEGEEEELLLIIIHVSHTAYVRICSAYLQRRYGLSRITQKQSRRTDREKKISAYFQVHSIQRERTTQDKRNCFQASYVLGAIFVSLSFFLSGYYSCQPHWLLYTGSMYIKEHKYLQTALWDVNSPVVCRNATISSSYICVYK